MEYRSLYRKWRPQTFEDIIGQKHITQTLMNAISLNRISHTYFDQLAGHQKFNHWA